MMSFLGNLQPVYQTALLPLITKADCKVEELVRAAEEVESREVAAARENTSVVNYTVGGSSSSSAGLSATRDDVFMAFQAGMSKGKGKGGKKTRGAPYNAPPPKSMKMSTKGQGKNAGSYARRCWHCDAPGHDKASCPLLRKK